MLVRQPRYCEHGRVVRITHLSIGNMEGRDIRPHQDLRQVEELVLWVLGGGELYLPLISCSALCGPHTLPGKHNGTDFEGVAMGEQTLRSRKLENWPRLLVITARDELTRAVLESSPW